LGAISLTTEVVTPARRAAMISLRIVMMLAHKVFLNFSHEFCADCENTHLIKNCHTSLVKSIAVRIRGVGVGGTLPPSPTQSWWHFVCTEYHGQMVMSKHMLQNRINIDGPIRTCSDNRHRSVLWRELGKKSKQITNDFPALIDCAYVNPRLKCSFFLFQLFPGQSKTQNDTIHYVHNNA
jgi:hypothetical protein